MQSIDVGDGAAPLGPHHHAAVVGDILLQAGGHDGRLGDEQRHRLPLHVGTHQRPVGVVVFEERNKSGGDADHLLGADVDVLHLIGRHRSEVAAEAGDDAFLRDLLAVGRRIGRRQVRQRFLIGAQLLHIVRQLAPLTARYGVMRKPYSSTPAKMLKCEIKPMFVPSGVSIGQIRP